MRWRQLTSALAVAILAASGGAGAQDKKDEKKPASAPAAQGKPCDCSKTAKGYYCVKCDRELTPDDIRGGACKKCETKPAPIEYCIKPGATKYIPTCHPEKASDKPVTWWFKQFKTPTVVEDRARITYECETCGAKANVDSELKHKPDCKPKAIGSAVKKVCMKSGKPPHVGKE